MARPIKARRICAMPQHLSFAPCGKKTSKSVTLAIEEYETLRLIDLQGFTQEDCASQMNVSRTTVQAIYDCARNKVADALVNGKKIVISGGNYNLCSKSAVCCGKDCRKQTCNSETCDDMHDCCRKKKCE